jgi:hypothetical protein
VRFDIPRPVTINFIGITLSFVGLDSVIGIATRYGPEGPGIESPWGRNFRTSADWPWGSHSLLYNGHRVFPEVKAAGA